jgi:hypothetical protein
MEAAGQEPDNVIGAVSTVMDAPPRSGEPRRFGLAAEHGSADGTHQYPPRARGGTYRRRAADRRARHHHPQPGRGPRLRPRQRAEP